MKFYNKGDDCDERYLCVCDECKVRNKRCILVKDAVDPHDNSDKLLVCKAFYSCAKCDYDCCKDCSQLASEAGERTRNSKHIIEKKYEEFKNREQILDFFPGPVKHIDDARAEMDCLPTPDLKLAEDDAELESLQPQVDHLSQNLNITPPSKNLSFCTANSGCLCGLALATAVLLGGAIFYWPDGQSDIDDKKFLPKEENLYGGPKLEKPMENMSDFTMETWPKRGRKYVRDQKPDHGKNVEGDWWKMIIIGILTLIFGAVTLGLAKGNDVDVLNDEANEQSSRLVADGFMLDAKRCDEDMQAITTAAQIGKDVEQSDTNSVSFEI